MANTNYKNMLLDARPDRLDLRDREYRPHLQALPPRYPLVKAMEDFLPCYMHNGLILNQGEEGACTGFGLAATINYLIWQEKMDFSGDEHETNRCCSQVKELLVSKRMLYHMARVYDEWDGEDYSGSSCRGAMKGWHRHGVCKDSLWEYNLDGKFIPPKSNWAADALSTPLGAYYRINHKSVVDMQAAIFEVGAIYCSAEVHEGWWLKKSLKMPVINICDQNKGGHAFCLIGYNDLGFIVQNSWGGSWGWNGFAVLRYSDWVANGSDAWVVSRGVPVKINAAPHMFANKALQDVATQRTDPAQAGFNKALKYKYPKDFKAMPWSENKAYEHALVISNNGRPKHTVIAAMDAEGSAHHICYHNLRNWLQASVTNRKIAIYAHGGFNSEESSINRVRIMAPYFKANGIYPLFVVWKTGLGETLANIVNEAVKDMFRSGQFEAGRVKGMGEWISDKTDRAIESVVRGIHAKSLWSEMKENANYASDRAVPGFAQNRGGKSGAMVLMAKSLQTLSKEFPGLEIHAVGHSAGAVLLGAWLNELAKRKMSLETVSLFAPACTFKFANRTYAKAFSNKVLKKRNLFIHNMNDVSEKADNTGSVYRKSLLYLVSRALEDVHKMPILGLEAAWKVKNYDESKSGGFHLSQKNELEHWLKSSHGVHLHEPYDLKKYRVKINLVPEFVPLSHGSFDNDIGVLEFTLKKITGATSLAVGVENLCGY